MSPFFRPPGFAAAIVVADAVAWEEAPLTLALQFITLNPSGGSLLARAIAFRAVAAVVLWNRLPQRVEAEVGAYEPLLRLVLA